MRNTGDEFSYAPQSGLMAHSDHFHHRRGADPMFSRTTNSPAGRTADSSFVRSADECRSREERATQHLAFLRSGLFIWKKIAIGAVLNLGPTTRVAYHHVPRSNGNLAIQKPALPLCC
jgi:hypothetical protein